MNGGIVLTVVTKMTKYEMEFHVITATGKRIGTIKGYNVFDLSGKKIFTVKPETTINEIIEILLYDKVTN